MRILNAKVEWYKSFHNRPSLAVLVDRMVKSNERVYVERENIHYSEVGGHADYFFYKQPGEGFGGRHFVVKMVGGIKKRCIGPWSSGAYGVNSVGLGPIVDVAITEDEKTFDRGFTFYHGAITVPLAYEAAKLAGCHLVKAHDLGSDNWYPSLDPVRLIKPFNRGSPDNPQPDTMLEFVDDGSYTLSSKELSGEQAQIVFH